MTTDARGKKSKKRSGTSSLPQPDQVVFFLDRNLGRHAIARKLRAENIQVEVRDDHFAERAPDEEWIRSVAERNWIAITKDKHIRYRAAEIGAIRDYRARAIVVVAKDATAEEIAEALIRGWTRIVRLATTTSGPFIAKIYRNGTVRLLSINSGES